MKKILFVCHGNICRSTMAEFVMKDLVRKADLEAEIVVDSKACRTDELGSDTYPGTKRALQAHGVPYTPRQARQITRADYEAWDYIVYMDEENRRDLMRLTGNDPKGKCSSLLSWAGLGREVADPWYTGEFETTYQDVSLGCEALLKKMASTDA